MIRHPFGLNSPSETSYYHLSEIGVEAHQDVKRGEVIGAVGDTGEMNDIVHLHFNVDGPVAMNDNPHKYWLDGPGRITCFKPGRAYDDDDHRLTYPVKCKSE